MSGRSNRMPRWTLLAALLGLGCAPDIAPEEDPSSLAPLTGTVGTGDRDPLFRAFHHILDVAEVDVVVNAAPEPLVSGFPLGASSAFLDFFPEGSHDVEVLITGSEELAAYFEGLLATEGEALSFVALGFHDPANQDLVGGEPGEVREIVLVEDLTPVDPGLVRLRIFHAATAGLLFAPDGLDVYLDGARIAEGLDYADSVVLEVGTGSRILEIDYERNGSIDRSFTLDLVATDYELLPLAHLSLLPGDVTAGEPLVATALLYPPAAQEPVVYE